MVKVVRNSNTRSLHYGTQNGIDIRHKASTLFLMDEYDIECVLTQIKVIMSHIFMVYFEMLSLIIAVNTNKFHLVPRTLPASYHVRIVLAL